jgi:imidazolonepropionase-like amidohydrolase
MAARSAVVALVSLAVAGCLFNRGNVRAADLALEHATVLDPVNHTARVGDVAISGGRIIAVVASYRSPAVKRIDLTGKFILPGFVDAHTHSTANVAPGKATARPMIDYLGTQRASELMVGAGVTAFLDLFNLEDSVLNLRDVQDERMPTGARLYAAGPCLTAPKGHCSEYGIPTRTIGSPQEAASQIRSLALKNPDVIKVVYDHSGYLPTIDKATLTQAVASARAIGRPSVIHISQLGDVRDAVDAGATVITHLPRDSVIPIELARRMAAKKISEIPTMVTPLDAAVFARDSAVRRDPLLARVRGTAIMNAYADSTTLPQYLKSLMASSGAIDSVYCRSIRNLYDAGVNIIVGTDAGNFGSILGWSVHREMQRLVNCGLSKWDALAAGTVNVRRFLGNSFGLKPRTEANLVILDASPLTGISNTKSITGVIRRGRWISAQS